MSEIILKAQNKRWLKILIEIVIATLLALIFG